MPNQLNIRLATLEDSRFFWELVNDPIVRQASFNSEEIPWEDHQKWYDQKLSETATLLFVAENDSHEKIGQIRLEQKSEGYVISVSLTKDFRGAGMGTELIKSGSEKLYEIFPDADKINAYIKHENKASIKAFAKAGYENAGSATIKVKDDAVLMVRENTESSTKS